MKRVIFDTNIYGKLILEENIEIIRKQIIEDSEFLIYGFKPIRYELRSTPKHLHLGRFGKRNLLLALYDELIKGRYLKECVKIDQIAHKFYYYYRQFGGIRNWKTTNISVDFTIVACASVYELEIVVSEDLNTLLSKPALKAYRCVTSEEKLWLPIFWKYSDLKKKYNF